MRKIRNSLDLIYQLPFELQIKILYKSGFITNEAKIIKDFNENLYIKIKDCVDGFGDVSYIEHLLNIGELKKSYLDEIILQLNIFMDSDSD